MDTIEKLNLNHIRAYRDLAYNSYPSFKDLSASGLDQYSRGLKDSMENDKGVEFYGFFREDKLLSVMRVFDFKMNYFDQIIPSSGLGYLGVDLLEKKQGLAHQMIDFYEELSLERGVALACLLPFRPDFYKSLGYGLGTKMNQYRIRPGDLPSFPVKSQLNFITEDNLDKLLNFQRKLLGSQHGRIGKIYDEIKDLLENRENKILGNFNSHNILIGYMVFRFENDKPGNLFVNNIYIKEMEYEDSNSLKVFLNFLRSQEDQVRLVIINTQDDNFHHLLDKPLNDSNNYIPYGNLESNSQAVGLMYKVLDIYRAFEQTQHRNFNNLDLDLNLAILNDQTQSIENYLLSFKEGHYVGRAKDCQLTLKIKLSDFSSLFMGSISLRSLYELGLAHISDQEKLDLLDRAFYCPVKPRTNTDF